MKISRFLELLSEENIADTDNVYSLTESGPICDPKIPTESAIISITEMEVDSIRLTKKGENTEKEKVVLLIEAFYNVDFLNCITVGQLKDFLEKVENKEEEICCVHPCDYFNGWCSNIADFAKCKPAIPALKTRKVTGDNILHLIH